MAMDDGDLDGPTKKDNAAAAAQQPSAPTSHSRPPAHDSPSQGKVLNLRQRKWNSARKEWQEWHDVQVTQTPDLPSPPGPSSSQSPATTSSTPITAIAIFSHPTN
ncbi:hypothetical protein BGX33_012569, partial [Mortierella sp. NVP41]